MSLLVFACLSCGTPEQPSTAQKADAPAPVDDAKRRFVFEVATKVDAIREAAKAGDFEKLGAQMCDDFDFGGASKGRDAALASWRADATRLPALVRTLDGDCELSSDEAAADTRWICRSRASDATREQAVLRHDDRGWVWCAFSP
ncbi:MAG TPA: hypothetical protein VG755_24680 [Nannocystaceae bacterium]|nr:hypothetical protein [Nannocystaceae bacterium]